MGIKPITATAFGDWFDAAPVMHEFLDTVGVHVNVIQDSDASNITNLGCNRVKVFGMI